MFKESRNELERDDGSTQQRDYSFVGILSIIWNYLLKTMVCNWLESLSSKRCRSRNKAQVSPVSQRFPFEISIANPVINSKRSTHSQVAAESVTELMSVSTRGKARYVLNWASICHKHWVYMNGLCCADCIWHLIAVLDMLTYWLPVCYRLTSIWEARQHPYAN